MRLGVYRVSNPWNDDSETTLHRKAVYDFESESWGDTSSGYIVCRVSANPSPEELVARIEIADKYGRWIVRTPLWAADSEHTVSVSEPEMSVSKGKTKRGEMGGPRPSKITARIERAHGVRVIPDEHITEETVAYAASNGFRVVPASEWEINWEKEFDFDFYTPSESDEV